MCYFYFEINKYAKKKKMCASPVRKPYALVCGRNEGAEERRSEFWVSAIVTKSYRD